MVLLRYQEPGGKRGIYRVSDMQNLNQYELLPLKLYSALQRQLVATGQAKGTPLQWIGTILNLQKKVSARSRSSGRTAPLHESLM